MKATLALTAMLGTAFGAFALPSVGGPVHYRVTRPFSMFATSTNDVATLGTAPLEFILTDIVIGSPNGLQGGGTPPTLLVNGTPVLQMPKETLAYIPGVFTRGNLHLTTGIFIPAGAVVSVTGANLDTGSGVHVSGYVQ